MYKHEARSNLRSAIKKGAPWWAKPFFRAIVKRAVTKKQVCLAGRFVQHGLELLSPHTKTEADDDAAALLQETLDSLGCAP